MGCGQTLTIEGKHAGSELADYNAQRAVKGYTVGPGRTPLGLEVTGYGNP